MTELRGDQPALDHKRISRTTDPRQGALSPADASPIQSANQTREKVALPLNRAGTHPGNPILAGLAMRVVIPLDSNDVLTGLFVFTDRADPKGNLVGFVSEGPRGLHEFDLPFVEGHVSIGSPVTGAKRNYIRQESRAGTFERTFWVQSKDFNVVQMNGLPALVPVTLVPDPLQLVQPNVVDPWIDVVVDFMVGWADEFHVEHRSENANLTPGFAKAYGGARTVSVFDTNPAPGQEGVGTEVNPYTEQLIAQTKKVQVENTVGLKRFTFRFRAKQGSGYFVDCPVEVNVTSAVCPPADPPVDSDNGGPEVYQNPSYIPPQTPPHTPVDIPGSDLGGGELVPYSVVGKTPFTWTDILEEPVMILQIQAQAAGANPTIVLRRWALVPSTAAHDGVALVFFDQKEYTPLVVPGATKPTHGAPYQPAATYRIGLSVSQEMNDHIGIYNIALKDGDFTSRFVPMFGPSIADIASLLLAGTGVSDPPVPT